MIWDDLRPSYSPSQGVSLPLRWIKYVPPFHMMHVLIFIKQQRICALGVAAHLGAVERVGLWVSGIDT